MIYKISYKYEEEKKPHVRFYNALSKSIAKEMFNETCSHGSLKGARVNLINIRKAVDSEKVKNQP
tara:strand:- start:329 stop:523 length:195 start_codon:yes stop_codon:yes gene_type:complete